MLSFLRGLVFAFAVAVAVGAFSSVLATPAAVSAAAPQPALFDTETVAQAHCPRDVVVWLNLSTGIYHKKGMRWYGRTKHGAFVCKKEADSAGDRSTRNGQ